MSSHPPPPWEEALSLLERGEPKAALETLGAAGRDGSPDARVAALLALLLSGSPEAGAPAHAPPEAPAEVPEAAAPAGGSEATAAVERTVLALIAGRRALAEGRTTDAIRHADQAGADVPDRWAWLPASVASLHQAVFRLAGHASHRDRGLELARRVADRTERPHMAVLARGIMATIHLLEGDLFRTLDRSEAALELAAATGLGEHRFVALAHQFRGYVLFEWNRVEEARAELERAWDLAGPDGAGVRSGVARTMVDVAAALGDEEAADRWMERLEETVSEPMSLRNREWLAAVRVRRGIHKASDLRTVDRWRRSYGYSEATDRAERDDLSSRLHELAHLCGVMEATRQWEALLSAADTLLRAARPHRRWFEAHALTAGAVALLSLGRAEEAEARFTEALRTGEPAGLVRTYTDGAPVRRELLRRAARGGSGPALRVLEAAGWSEAAAPLLTAKQVEALGLVATGLSNRELAAALCVSESTVRTHLRAIFSRLEVRSRTQAVAAARRLGLLG